MTKTDFIPVMTSVVVITKAPIVDYMKNFVSLPKDYGSPQYYARQDIQAIMTTVKKNLEILDEKIHFLLQLKGKKVLLKPNLVSVFYQSGFKKESYPETTDPRVMDAIIHFLKPYAKEIVIAESSGRGMPTRGSFKLAGYDRIAKFHNISLIALEEQPVDRYILPKAKVSKEVYIPKIFSEVIQGETFYISVPKMKTNLYTKVTLGFKNAMGVLPYNLRQRNHNYHINEKLVDLLYLFKPNLVIIDGIIGGEGNTPAPVDPVQTHLILSGNNSVETDRAATRIMGFDPDKIKLISYATQLGFGDSKVEIIGPQEVIPFLPADPSLISERFISQFPNTKLLIGHMKNTAPKISTLNSSKKIEPTLVPQIESACDGGCIPSLRTAFDYIRYMGLPTDFHLVIVLGSGIQIGDQNYYFDRDGKAYTPEEIGKLSDKKLAMGTCSNAMQKYVDSFLPGCMPKPADGVFALFSILKYPNYIMNPFHNKHLFTLLWESIHLVFTRKKLLKQGIWLDCPSTPMDKIFEPRELSETEKQRDFIRWELPPMTQDQQITFLKDETIKSLLIHKFKSIIY